MLYVEEVWECGAAGSECVPSVASYTDGRRSWLHRAIMESAVPNPGPAAAEPQVSYFMSQSDLLQLGSLSWFVETLSYSLVQTSLKVMILLPQPVEY